MGKYTGNNGNGAGCYTIFASNMDDMAPWSRRQFEYPDDADPNSW